MDGSTKQGPTTCTGTAEGVRATHPPVSVSGNLQLVHAALGPSYTHRTWGCTLCDQTPQTILAQVTVVAGTGTACIGNVRKEAQITQGNDQQMRTRDRNTGSGLPLIASVCPEHTTSTHCPPAQAHHVTHTHLSMVASLRVINSSLCHQSPLCSVTEEDEAG